jgi:hypothetical protein
MDNNKEQKNYGWEYFENIYNNMKQSGETFSEEMGQHIKEEIKKMYKQREEWLKNQENIKREENEQPNQ